MLRAPRRENLFVCAVVFFSIVSSVLDPLNAECYESLKRGRQVFDIQVYLSHTMEVGIFRLIKKLSKIFILHYDFKVLVTR